MTREEIEELKGLAASMGLYDDKNPCKRAVILGKAIQELEQEPTTKNDLGVDCISRAEVNQVIEDYMDEQYHVLSDRTRERAFGAKAVMARINELPSVTLQEPKTGHWIRELIRNEKGGCIGAKMICSECGNDNKHDEYMNYCPNCGAKMVEPQESEG